VPAVPQADLGRDVGGPDRLSLIDLPGIMAVAGPPIGKSLAKTACFRAAQVAIVAHSNSLCPLEVRRSELAADSLERGRAEPLPLIFSVPVSVGDDFLREGS
jgi:hypothetical protein